MGKAFDHSKDKIAVLCSYFRTNRLKFVAPGVKEAHIRQSLIDPFFKSLGWDVNNEKRIAPQYREVVPEDSLEIEGHQTAPDYTFRVGDTPKFYAEAKKCVVKVPDDPEPANQLRRYGWSAKIAVSILTNFESLAVYDCTLRPHRSDKAGYGRIFLFGYEEYTDRWHEIWDVFSHESMWSGAFDEYAASKRKRGTSEVDDEFLKEIESWRETLARNIALRNRDLSADELNSSVQLTIDRVVFLRMAEDRGLEPYEQLLTLCGGPNIYSRFVRDLRRRTHSKYNSGLFHFQKETGVADEPDRITPKLDVDDRVFKAIIESLYFAYGSPYHFGVLPVEILGTIYERFLGSVIRLTAGHRAKVEEKPEVRKAGGVYYTPANIGDYIVEHTVAERIERRSPSQLAGSGKQAPFRVLDMACGSGSFLLRAYKCLLDRCLKWYIAHQPQKHKRAVYCDDRLKQWRLTIDEKKRILTTHIFGVDIDPQAVEVSKLSLLLKVLEGETDQSLIQGLLRFGDRALPNLADNIKCGNSIIGSDYFNDENIVHDEDVKRINAFDWREGFPAVMKAGGFNCIIGNPPYLFITEVTKSDRDYYQRKYTSVTYRFDLYGTFIERALRTLLAPKACFGFIIPHTLLSNDSFQRLRSMLAKEAHVYRVVDLGPGAFQNARNETMLLFFENVCPRKTSSVQVVQTDPKTLTGHPKGIDVRQRTWATADGAPWLVKTSKHGAEVIAKMLAVKSTLADFCTANQGLRTGDNEKYLSSTKRSAIWKRAAGGKQIGIYAPIPDGLFVYYKPEVLDAPRRKEIFDTPEKIVVQEIRSIALHRRIVATLDTGQTFCLQSTNVINKKPDVEVDLRYVLGVLNSSLVNHFFRLTFPGNNHIPSNRLLRIPVPRPPSQRVHDRLVRLVSTLLELNRYARKKSTARESLDRQIAATDRVIEGVVCSLFGLRPDILLTKKQRYGSL
jgi:hypothetical protein